MSKASILIESINESELSWRESTLLRPTDKEWVTSVGKVKIIFNNVSNRLKYLVGNNVTFGKADTLEAAKQEVESVKDKLLTVKTMNQLLKIV